MIAGRLGRRLSTILGITPMKECPLTAQSCLSRPRRSSSRLDEIHHTARSPSMSDDAAHLRSEAKRCRRLAENVSSDQDQAMLKRVAKDFDEAADQLEKKTG